MVMACKAQDTERPTCLGCIMHTIEYMKESEGVGIALDILKEIYIGRR
jgi:hypothetical protein